MVNTTIEVRRDELTAITKLVALYVVLVLATFATLALLSDVDRGQAPSGAWIHAAIVGWFALLLPLRLNAARRGSRRAVVAVGIIATVLMVVNVVEALVPGLFPIWMRIEMVGIAVLMAVLAAQVVRLRPLRR